MRKKVLMGWLILFVSTSFCKTVLGQNRSDVESRVDSIANIGFVELTSSPQKYEKLFLKALSDADSLSLTNQSAVLNSKLSTIYSYLGKAGLKIEYKLNSIRLYEELDSLKKAGFEYTELAWLLRQTDLDKSIEYMRRGLAILSGYAGSIEQANAFNNYGLIKLAKKEPDSALYFINRSLNIKESLNDTLGIAYSHSYIANVYMETGQFQKAINTLDQAIEIRNTINDKSGISIDLVNAGMSYMTIGELEKALKYLKRSLLLAYETENIGLASFAFNTISNTFEQQGRYDSALVYYKSFNNFSDSLDEAKYNERIAELEVQFRTEENEKELAQKEAELTQEQLKVKRRNWTTGIFGLLFLSISFISFLFIRQQKIKRENLIKEKDLKLKLASAELENKIHHEKERISRDLHDNVGSQITNLITGIEISNMHIAKGQQEQAGELLKNLDEDARNTMTDLRETIWLLDKEKVRYQDFEKHLEAYIQRQERYFQNLEVMVQSEVQEDLVLEPSQSLNLMRIIQEALNNARKYSEASKVLISLISNENQIEVVIKDNGKGMELDKELNKGNGLENMFSRAKEMNAEFNIISIPQKGTEIKLSIEHVI
ncbi:MAG: tetratricopeptide repeat protein [Balneola sp.]|jgi:signal transduction histidine kinase